MTKRYLLALVALLLVTLACEVQSPTSSPPQQTAGALNSTYEAEATLTVAPPSATMTATVTPTPSASPTSSIIEVTPEPTSAGPIEVGTAVDPTGSIFRHDGWYTPDETQNLRTCPSMTCEAVPSGALIGKHTYPVQGWINNFDGTVWMCEVISVDIHGAELCIYATMFWDPKNGGWGTYIPAVETGN